LFTDDDGNDDDHNDDDNDDDNDDNYDNDDDTWYKIRHAGTQVAQWDFQKQRQVKVDWRELLCFGCPAV